MGKCTNRRTLGHLFPEFILMAERVLKLPGGRCSLKVNTTDMTNCNMADFRAGNKVNLPARRWLHFRGVATPLHRLLLHNTLHIIPSLWSSLHSSTPGLHKTNSATSFLYSGHCQEASLQPTLQNLHN